MNSSASWALLAVESTLDVLAHILGKGAAHIQLPGESGEQQVHGHGACKPRLPRLCVAVDV